MPPVLTCLLGKRLCEDPAREPHWDLRQEAAQLIGYICRTFGDAYTTLIPRVSKTLMKTLLDGEKPLASHFGAIVGIAALGQNAFVSLLLPILPDYLAALHPELRHQMTDSDTEEVKRMEIAKVYDALLQIARIAVQSDPSLQERLAGLFGTDL